MMDRINELLKKEPGLGIARRSSLLVAASGPYQSGVQRKLDKFPVASLAFAGAISSFYVAMTAVPQLAIEQAADKSLGGRPITPEQVAARTQGAPRRQCGHHGRGSRRAAGDHPQPALRAADGAGAGGHQPGRHRGGGRCDRDGLGRHPRAARPPQGQAVPGDDRRGCRDHGREQPAAQEVRDEPSRCRPSRARTRTWADRRTRVTAGGMHAPSI